MSLISQSVGLYALLEMKAMTTTWIHAFRLDMFTVKFDNRKLTYQKDHGIHSTIEQVLNSADNDFSDDTNMHLRVI